MDCSNDDYLTEEIMTEDEANTELNNGSIMLDSRELTDTERDIMKGDTVGDTVYSARWIIRTLKSLLQVTDDNFNSSTESDLCMIWDMSGDKDVIEFLLKLDIFDLITHVMKVTTHSRLTEIMLGIIGNITCHNETLNILVQNDELVEIIFHYLTDNDDEVVLQVIRIFKCIVWNIQTNKASPWTEKVNECLAFGQCVPLFLANSKNEQLLMVILDLLDLITTISEDGDKWLENWFDIEQLMAGLHEYFDQWFASNDEYSQDELKKINNMLNVCNYIVHLDRFLTGKVWSEEAEYRKTTNMLRQILMTFFWSSTVPLTDITIHCIGTSVEIMMCIFKCKNYYEWDVIALVPSFIVAFKSDLEKTTIDKEDLSQEIGLVEYLEKCWSYMQMTTSHKNMRKVQHTCEDILKNKRNICDDELQELMNILKI